MLFLFHRRTSDSIPNVSPHSPRTQPNAWRLWWFKRSIKCNNRRHKLPIDLSTYTTRVYSFFLDPVHSPIQGPFPLQISNVHPDFEEMAPQITLYFLQASRCIRTAWQLHELGLDYAVKFSPREGGLAPPAFRKEVGGLGKFPTLVDGDVTVTESGNIGECVSMFKVPV